MRSVYFLLLIVMMLWGFNVSALKVLVSAIDPVMLTAVRIFTAGITVLIITYFMGFFRLPRKNELFLIIYIGLFNVIAHHIFLALGLTRTSSVNAGLILGMGPLLTMMLSILLLKDQVTRLRVTGFILGFLGVVMTTLGGAAGFSALSLGDVFVFISIFTQAVSFILISKLNPSFDPRLLTGYMLTIGSFFIGLTSVVTESNFSQLTSLFTWKLGAVFLFSAVLCTAFGHMTYNFAIKQVGPVETAIFINLNTLFALIGASIFLGEPIYKHHIIGFGLILAGIFIGSGALEYMLLKRKQRQT
ncbi:MAG TPA: DMT family transporter [Bacillota bacterium]|nr:DMT family transporter [Bacillota bacterium]